MKGTNFRIHPTAWLVHGCLLACFWGCAKPETDIGLGLTPDSEVLSLSVTDTITVELQTIREDSLETGELSTGLLGRVLVPNFGWVTAGFATQLRLSATDFDFGASPVADSVRLRLAYTGDFYGQLYPQVISVRPLTDSLSLDSNYYSNATFNAGEEWGDMSAGPLSFEPHGADSSNAHASIPILTSVGQEIIEQGADVFSGNSSWFDYMPGLLVESNTGGHGVVAIDISSGLSTLRVHFHNDTDTSFYDFLISPLSARVNLFGHDFQGDLDVFDGPNSPGSIDGGTRGYVLSASGTKLNVRFPHLSSFQDELGGTPVVLKAELEVPVESQWSDKPVPSQEQLFVLLSNADGDGFGSTPDQNAPISVGGQYDASRNAYVFNLTSTVQALMRGQLSGRELYLVSNRAGISVAGVVVQGTQSPIPTKLTLTLGS